MGTLINTVASGFFFNSNLIAIIVPKVFPVPVHQARVPLPPASSHRLIPSFCRSVLSIKIDLIVPLGAQSHQ